jgi:UDPglucose--hexose-1-phosphate uridylyltransferase
MAQRRYDPVSGRWRAYRGPRQAAAVPSVDGCALCLNGVRSSIAVLDNPYRAPADDPPPPAGPDHALYRAGPASGADEIVVYTDRLGGGLADLSVGHATRLVDVWADRYAVLGARDEIRYIEVSELATPASGHPHTNVRGYPDIPAVAARELAAAGVHRSAYGTCVYCDVIARERADGVRVIADNAYFLAFVPFAPRSPLEVHVAAHRHATSLLDLTDPERAALARLLTTVAAAMAGLPGPPSEHLMVMHQAPTDDDGWLAISHVHVEFSARQWDCPPGAEEYLVEAIPEHTAAELRRVLG